MIKRIVINNPGYTHRDDLLNNYSAMELIEKTKNNEAVSDLEHLIVSMKENPILKNFATSDSISVRLGGEYIFGMDWKSREPFRQFLKEVLE